MGIARVLSKQKLIMRGFLIMLIPLMLIGCKETMVNYGNFLEKPIAIKKGDSFEINLGYTAASANWIKPSFKFEEDALYISGTLTFKERPNIVTIKLPDATKKYRVYWVDSDGRKTELKLRE